MASLSATVNIAPDKWLKFLLGVVMLYGHAFGPAPSGLAEDLSSSSGVAVDPGEITERGRDFAVFQRISADTGHSGRTQLSTNSFTLLENNLHYLDQGVWKESDDSLEANGDGVAALHGPDKAFFAPELNASEVFRVEMSEGGLFRGGLRQIRVTDSANGRTAVIGVVRNSVKAQLLPPSSILFEDAFVGLDADVLLVWKHNQFSQDLVVRRLPRLPDGFSPFSSRLEVVTEVLTDREPELRSQNLEGLGGTRLTDHTVIDFGSFAMIVGTAHPAGEREGVAVGSGGSPETGLPVMKQWIRTEDGLHFLVESIAWSDAGMLGAKSEASIGPNPRKPDDFQHIKSYEWPRRPVRSAMSGGPLIARANYEPKGALLDFVTISGGGTPTTFATGTTYYIKTYYYSGAAVTFQAGCTIKFKDNAYLLLYGSPSFPSSGTSPIFTSRNDNNYGELISGVTGETDSDGNPQLHRAAQEVWIYYVNFGTTLQNCRFRYAKKGVQYDSNAGVTSTHYINSSTFEQSQTALQNNLAGGSVVLTSDKKCVVTSATAGSGITSGSMTADCGVVTEAFVNDPSQDTPTGDPTGDSNKNSQSECSFVVVDSSTIVAAFFDTHLSEYGLGELPFSGITSPRSTGWAVSTDGGASFTDHGGISPATPSSTTLGDAGGPQIVRNNSSGALYMVVNPSREASTWKGFRVWKSNDNGASFSQISSDVFGGTVLGGDKGAIQINNSAGSTSGYIYTAGRGGDNHIHLVFSSDNGSTWQGATDLGVGQGPDIVIAGDGTVYVFYLTLSGSPLVNTLCYNWKTTTGSWSGQTVVPAHPGSTSLYATGAYGSTDPKRSNTAPSTDTFITDSLPRAALHPNNKIYMVYADLASSTTNLVDRGDIFMNEGTRQTDGSLSWSGSRMVNHDGTMTDQWNPSIAINPDGTVFAGFYSRQESPTINSLIKAYGAKATLAGSVVLANATFDVFPISSSSFGNLFPGTTVSASQPWLFDTVWVQDGVCLDTSAKAVASCGPTDYYVDAGFGYPHFTADDYSWSSADGSYFYFAWRDCTYTTTVNFSGTSYSGTDANVRLGKVRK